MLHEIVEDADRVVLVTNTGPERELGDQADAMTPEAIAFLGRLGVIRLRAPTLVALWKVSLEDLARARTQVECQYAHVAGTFEIPASALR